MLLNHGFSTLRDPLPRAMCLYNHGIVATVGRLQQPKLASSKGLAVMRRFHAVFFCQLEARFDARVIEKSHLVKQCACLQFTYILL